jgi:hypothetical protein
MPQALALIWLLLIAAPADARRSLAEIAPAYQTGCFTERVTLRLSDDLGATTQELIVRGDGGRVVVVEFAELRASMTRKRLAVERVGDPSRVYVAPVRTTPAATFAERLPGVPAIQVALAFGEPELACWPLNEPGGRFRVDESETGRLGLVVAEPEHGERVRLDIEALPATEAPEAVAVANRTRVESVRDLLRPSDGRDGGLVRAGDDAPPLLLLGIDMRPWILASRDAGAVALVLCRRETPGASAGFGAALDVSEDDRAPLGYTAALGVCVEPFNQPLLDHLRELRNRWGRWVKWTVAPETTIDRFAPQADAVLIVIDALDTVRTVIELDDRGSDQSQLAREILAALSEPAG